MIPTWAEAIRGDLGANPRTDAHLHRVGTELLEVVGLAGVPVAFAWAQPEAMAGCRGVTSPLVRPIAVRLATDLTVEGAVGTLLHELGHVVAVLATPDQAFHTATGHHGEGFQLACRLVADTFNITPPNGNDDTVWPRLGWERRMTATAPGW